MYVAMMRNTLVVRFGERFALEEAARIEEELSALAAVSATDLSHVTLDFSEVRDFEDAAIVPLAGCLRRFGVRIQTRGLTIHEQRMLAYFGIPLDSAPGSIRRDADDDREPDHTGHGE